MTIVLLMLSVLFAVSCSDSGESVTAIGSVEINKDKTKITLKATLDESYAESHSKDKLYVMAISETNLKSSLDSATVIGELKAKKSMSLKFSLYDDNGFSRLTCGYVLAEKKGDSYIALTPPAYIQNPEILSESSSEIREPVSIKGFEQNDILDAELLGGSHIVLEASIDKLLLPSYFEDAIRYNYNGVTYFFDKEAVEELDTKVGEAETLKMRIYLRTVLSYPENGSGRAPMDFLYCDKAGKADGYVVNMADREANRYTGAFYSFLASRYSGEYGNVSDYIIGDKVNEYNKNCNAGAATAEEFEKLYYSWVRVAHLVLSAQNANACVYVPVSNSWRAESLGGVIGSKAFLSRFAADAEKGGDYNYSLAFDLGRGEDLPALLGSETQNSSTVGVNALPDIMAFSSDPDIRFKSEQRRLIIDGLSLDASVSQKNRAAYYTYAYYTALQNGFDAFIYSSDESSLYTAEGNRSDLYYSVFMCGSSLYSQLSGYTDKIKGHPDMKFSEYANEILTYNQKTEVQLPESVGKTQLDFPVSFTDFISLGSICNSQISLAKDENSAPSTAWLIESAQNNGFGAVSTTLSAESIISSGYIGVSASSDGVSNIALVITDGSTGGKAHTYIGEAKLANASTTYYFKISDYVKELEPSKTLTLSVVVFPSDSDDASIEITDISLYGSSGAGSETIIIIAIVAAVALASVGLIAWLVIRRKKKSDENSYDE